MTSAHSPSLETVPYLLIFYVVTYRRLSGLTFRGLAQVSVVHIRCHGIIHCLYCCFSCSVYTHSRYPSRSYLRHVAVDGLALTFVFFIRGNLPYDCTALGTIHSGIEGIHCTGDRQRQTSRTRRRRRERVRNDVVSPRHGPSHRTPRCISDAAVREYHHSSRNWVRGAREQRLGKARCLWPLPRQIPCRGRF